MSANERAGRRGAQRRRRAPDRLGQEDSSDSKGEEIQAPPADPADNAAAPAAIDNAAVPAAQEGAAAPPQPRQVQFAANVEAPQGAPPAQVPPPLNQQINIGALNQALAAMQQLTQQITQQLQQQQQAAAPQQPVPMQPAPIMAQPQQIPPVQQQRNQPPMALVGIYGQGVLTPPTRGHQDALDFVSQKMDLSYAGDKPGANSLLHHLQDKARQVNLYEVFEVTTAQGQVLNLFDHYLSISLQQVKAAAIARWNTNTWNRQGSYMLSLSLLKSLSTSFHTHIISHKPKYSMQSGYSDVALVLKTILSQVFPTTTTGTNNVLTQLSQLDIKDHENNQLNLHQEFKRLVGIMHAAPDGLASMNKLMQRFYLLESYKTIKCDAFTMFVLQQKNQMNVPSIDKIMDQSEQNTRDALRKKKKAAKSAKKKKGKKQRGTTDDNWITTPPSPGKEDKPIERDGKEWNWCIHHQKYVVAAGNRQQGPHSSATCTLNPKNQK
ncbi:unnamed protein product [Cylindrotheca closterium]|uniref:Uncharacterized protein n=1 Tax=Cylindrotheca closterium TaxID=2856 RepID=A0AAD2JNS2_9STRA|nr:unnamed protein product [Cylindrotheca closterium]